MRVLIVGAAGMVGQQILGQLAKAPDALGGPISELVLADLLPAAVPAELAAVARVRAEDVSQPAVAAALAALRCDLVIYLASIVSGEAESDLGKGYGVNFDGTRAFVEAVRLQGNRPKLLFASSIAVFGAPFPEIIPDDFFCTPLTSYGTQKAMLELLITDYSRRGFVDGACLRLPTLVVRPGKANLAASSFFSSIIREPLKGEKAVLPVAESVRHYHASPGAAAGFFVHAAGLDLIRLGDRRALTMPGLTCSVAEQIEALRRFAGQDAVRLIRRAPDPMVARIVGGWPQAFEAGRARALGFTCETSFDQIIAAHARATGLQPA